MRVLFFAAVSTIALSGCVYIGGDDRYDGGGAAFGPEFGGPERLYGAMVEPDGVRVIAASNGCTSEDSFRVDVDRFTVNGVVRYRVEFDRTNPDRCRAYMPEGVELFFPRERLGLPSDALISITNRIGR